MEEMYHKGSAAVKSIPGFGLETQKAARNSGLTSSPVFLLPHLDTLESKRFPRVFSEWNYAQEITYAIARTSA